MLESCLIPSSELLQSCHNLIFVVGVDCWLFVIAHFQTTSQDLSLQSVILTTSQHLFHDCIKHPVPPDTVKPSFVILDIRTLLCSGMSVRVSGCQKLQMTYSLTRCGTCCFIAVPIWQQWVSEDSFYMTLHYQCWHLAYVNDSVCVS